MEVAGLAIGTVALVGVFGDCVELLSYIGAAKSMNQDYAVLATRLDIQKVLLHQWANRMNLFDPKHYDKRLDDPEIGPLISQGLDCIRQLLQDGQKLEKRYGVRPAKIHESIEPPTALSDRLMSQFSSMTRKLRSRRDVQSLQLYQAVQSGPFLDERHNTQYIAVDKVRWIIKDKEQFEGLVQSLADLIADINAVIPPQSGDSTNIALQHEITNLSSVSELRAIKSVLPNEDINITSEVETAIDQECAKLILNRLWFRLIDDRKDSISEAYSETFKWALEPTDPDSNWSDLGQWLRSGAGIYWISGKPGSGKSTLMKYLFENSKAPELLKIWAGSRKLTMANFFLWNVGSPEQNTLNGLARGLLYHVLEENQSLIPFVIPNMWQEAQSGVKDLKLPSSTELNRAFQQLGKASTQGAFAFFIDGIDEFKGSDREGISFIQKLATSAHIKILLSSRPIDTCVAAFRTRPQLRLHDLTKRDIEKYVNDTIRSYLDRNADSYLYEADVQELIVILQRKAEGVFLWVVLACRRLFDHFDAYDMAEEIRRTVDQLPLELEDLFRSIIEDIPQGVRQQASKLLRVCHIQRSIALYYHIPTFALAWADENGMVLDKLKELTRYSPDEMKKKSVILEGRLRSRCRGLIEVHGDASKGHLVGAGEDYPYVDFMHRTVFEFLDNTDALEIECLKIDDTGFDPIAVLGCMYCYLLFLNAESGGDYPNFSLEYFQILKTIHDNSLPNLAALLDCLVVAIRPLVARKGRNEGRPTQAPTSRSSSPDDQLGLVYELPGDDIDQKYIALQLAVEMNLHNSIKKSDVEEYNAVQRVQTTSKLSNLLVHAIIKPITELVVYRFYEQPLISETTIGVLLDLGCDPNQIVVEYRTTTTPWLIWLGNKYFRAVSTWDLGAAQIIARMLKAGADLSPQVPHSLGDLRIFLKDQMESFIRLKTRKFHEDRLAMTACCMEIAKAIGFQDDVDLMDKIRVFEQKQANE